MSAKMTFSLGRFQMQRKVEPKLDRVLLEYSFGIHFFPPKLRSLESHTIRARENHRGDLVTSSHSADGEIQDQREKASHCKSYGRRSHNKFRLGTRLRVVVSVLLNGWRFEINGWLKCRLNKGKASLRFPCYIVAGICSALPVLNTRDWQHEQRN